MSWLKVKVTRIKGNHASEDSSISKFLHSGLEEWKLETPSEPPGFRVSSLPYCGILDLVSHLYPESGSFSYRDQLYFSLGTTIHSLFQTVMCNSTMGDKSFGNWKCNICGWESDTKKPRFRPKKCPECGGNFWEYVEIIFQRYSLSGHTDYVWQDPDGKWVCIELKTTSMKKIELGPKSDLPYPMHIVQVETYCTLLKEQYGIDVDRYVLIYISRERHDKKYVCPSVPFTEQRFRKRLQHLNLSQRSRSAVKKLLKPETPNKGEYLDTIIVNRPCWSKKDYKKDMSCKFTYADKPCEFLKLCSQGDKTKDLRKTLVRMLKETKE